MCVAAGSGVFNGVALRKESVDRNFDDRVALIPHQVALRKESVDRNYRVGNIPLHIVGSLSARRAWIEIDVRKSTAG